MKLPPLPEQAAWMFNEFDEEGPKFYYTADQMREYAAAAIEAYKASLNPVAWTGTGVLTRMPIIALDGEPRSDACSPWFPLYRLDDQP